MLVDLEVFGVYGRVVPCQEYNQVFFLFIKSMPLPYPIDRDTDLGVPVRDI